MKYVFSIMIERKYDDKKLKKNDSIRKIIKLIFKTIKC